MRNRSFRDVMRQLVDQHGDNESRLARACGVTPQRISAWTRGESVPDLVNLVKLSHGTGFPLVQLIGVLLEVHPSQLATDRVHAAIAADPNLDDQARSTLLTAYAERVDATEARRERRRRASQQSRQQQQQRRRRT